MVAGVDDAILGYLAVSPTLRSFSAPVGLRSQQRPTPRNRSLDGVSAVDQRTSRRRPWLGSPRLRCRRSRKNSLSSLGSCSAPTGTWRQSTQREPIPDRSHQHRGQYGFGRWNAGKDRHRRAVRAPPDELTHDKAAWSRCAEMIRSVPADESRARLSAGIAVRATDESPWGMPHFECKAGGVIAVSSRGRVRAGVQGI